MRIASFQLAQAVCLTKPSPGGGRTIDGELLGSCFRVGGGAFLTAGHVVRALAPDATRAAILVSLADTSKNVAISIVDSEALDCDIGILRLAEDGDSLSVTNYCYPIPWRAAELTMLDDVRCFSYAHGIHRAGDELSTLQRAHKGYVISAPHRYMPLGYTGTPFAAYEVSFQAPRGASGAPLLLAGYPPTVAGVLIGNSQARMLVFDSEERIAESGETSRVEYFEALTMGVAVRRQSLWHLESRILGSSIGDYVCSVGPAPRDVAT